MLKPAKSAKSIRKPPAKTAAKSTPQVPPALSLKRTASVQPNAGIGASAGVLEVQSHTSSEADAALVRYTELYDFAPVSYITLDRDGTIHQVNLTGAELLNTARNKLAGQHFELHVAGSDRAIFRNFLARLFSSSGKEFCELELERKDGSRCQVRIEASTDTSGQTCRAVLMDITEQKQTQQNLLTLYTAIEQSPISVVVTDADANIQYVNPSFTEVTGYSAGEVAGQNSHILNSGQIPKETFQDMWSTISSGQAWHGEFVNKRKNGEPYWGQVQVLPVSDLAGKISQYVSLETDITLRKQAELVNEVLLQQTRALTRRMFSIQEEERRKIALELHDELGQWLTAIQAEAVAIGSASAIAPSIQAGAQAISQSASAMHDVVHRMVHNLRPSILDALGLVESLHELEKQWCQPHLGITCDFMLASDLDGLSDELKITLFRLVQEALNNIASYAHASHVSVQLRRVAGVTPDADVILLSVEDDGAGFDPAQPTEGTGLLGMRERSIAMGGEFELDSKPGQGVRINIKLPLKNPWNGMVDRRKA